MKNSASNPYINSIGKYINMYGWSDINPVGKIVGVHGVNTVIVQGIKAIRQTTKMEFEAGGFAAVCINQEEQQWEMVEDGEIFKIRLSKLYLKRARIEDSPRKFYDYNF